MIKKEWLWMSEYKNKSKIKIMNTIKINKITKQSTTVNEFKIGKFKSNYPINKLKESLVNRDIVENHTQTFENKIKEFGWLSPVIIDDLGNIIEGHHRVISATKLKLKTVPVYIVNWVDTNNLNDYQKYIISLNNSNRNWSALDYLKSYARNKKDYTFVYEKYNKTKNIFSVGNVLNIFFNCGTSKQFKYGNSEINNLEYSLYLFENFLRLKSIYGGTKFQAFTINRTCTFAHQKSISNKNIMNYIFKQMESLAKNNSPLLSSVEMIRPWLKEQVSIYKTK